MIVQMVCDATPCLREVRRAPRIVIPSRTPSLVGHRPIRIMTTLHYCDLHSDAFVLSGYWSDRIKRRAEDRAREIRPYGFRPDFDAAWVELVLVTTPEYRAFLSAVQVIRAA